MKMELSMALRWQFRRPGRPHGLPGPLVVSLTSYPKRFGVVARTLKCLLTQSVQPDHVVLWVAHDEYALVPPDVLALQKAGLEIRATDDMRQYNKLIPSLKAYPNAYICTADDDLFYPFRWLEGMTEAATDPNVIPCLRAHEIRAGDTGAYLSYNDWQLDTEFRGLSPALFPTGCGGVLYPPGVLAPETCDADKFMRLCPHNDDIWLFWMARNAGTRHQTVARRQELIGWKGSQDAALFHHNVLENGNDTQIQAMAAEFGYPDVSH